MHIICLFIASIKDVGKKFQLANVKDVNYRTEETPSESENVNNNHAYEYDANGNLVYVNTSRTKKDGVADEKTAERKLKWDEENRLLASDDNGFVTNYWYDADGERTVKTSGESDQVYVNSEFAGGRTNTAKFSLYVSPYLVANQGGRYTKHIYIGSQRVVSKIGDFDSYGSDPRRIQYAGSETDGLSVDYKAKYTGQLQVIKDNYATFAVPYNGEDNNDYIDGKGFCCNDGSLEAAQARAMAANIAKAKAVNGNFKENDDYEKMQFYYHPDHLGSSSYITNLDGEVVQHIEYVPFGEVFIEERNNIWNTPYLFNAKEFDEETGLYYYGARYYEPRVSLWISVDPIANYNPLNSENYLDGEHNNGVFNHKNLNCYSYCYGNPIKFSDPNGKQVVAVHGTWSNSDTWKDQKGIFEYAHKKFNNNRKNFLFNWSGKNNRTGRTVAAKSLITYISKLRKNVSQNEPLTLVGHSHGGNVSIEAINMLVNMPEFDDIKINLLTINTPVREDYQLSSKAQSRVTHINVYDPLDPVQSRGGNDYSIPFAGEMGKAGRTFKNATNIEVNHPQGLIDHWEYEPASNQAYPVCGDFHNSHNRVKDWSDK